MPKSSFVDEYWHLDNSVIYVTENIPGPCNKGDKECEIIQDNFNAEFTEGCDCEGPCLLENDCSCLLRFGINYTKVAVSSNQNSSYKVLPTKVTGSPIYECHDNCKCQLHCDNRVVQHGPISGLIIKDYNDKGLGLETSNAIRQYTFVCEYAGEVLSEKQTSERYRENLTGGHMNYIFCLNEYNSCNKVQTFVDPSKFGNIARYINHNCDPNCFILPVRVNSPIPKLCIFALRDIQIGEELSFDYGFDITKTDSDNAENRIQCLCGAGNCRKYLPFNSTCSNSPLCLL